MQIEVRGVTKRFGGLQALDGVSLRARTGEVTAVIGPNGAGKSTLMDCLSGITRMDAGELAIDGAVCRGNMLAQLVGLGITRTFQNIRLFESLDALEHVVLARLAYLRSQRAGGGSRPSRRAIEAEGLALLERVGLAAKARRHPAELAYGERRRLEIARGLATEPRLLLLDEPAAGSTGAEQQVLAGLIEAIAAQGVAVVLVEHHMDLVARVAAEVVVLNFGRVIVTGTIDEVRHHPEVISAYLGTIAKAAAA